MSERVAVIGDVGGHLAPLRAELQRLGAHDDRLPDDLTVVQVGDLIHRGPDSAGVIELVDHYLRGGRWIQLVGNHEAQYLREPAFDWPERLARPAVDALRRWWSTGDMVAAVALESPTERFLVTHAGVTHGYWERVLGANPDPALVAKALNSFVGSHEDVLFNAGQMLGGGRPDPLAGPVWASSVELLGSWSGRPLPFSQVHGHSRTTTRLPAAVASSTSVDEVTRHEVTRYDGGRIIGVDPGHSRRARESWQAWVLEGRPPPASTG